MLAADVRKLAADEDAPAEVRDVARQLQERHIYPVDFQVIDTTGKLHAQAAANDHIPSYIGVLKSGLE